MDSREDWTHPCRKWRKREAYIALMRYIKTDEPYRQWDCFRFEDYLDRQDWAETFHKRHLPLSNGDPANFKGPIQNPDCWDSTADKEPPRKKSRKEDDVTRTIVRHEVKVYDPATGRFISL